MIIKEFLFFTFKKLQKNYKCFNYQLIVKSSAISTIKIQI